MHFPALALGDSVVVYKHESELGPATKYALKSRCLERLEFINADGTVFRISGFEQVRESFWKRPKTPFGRGVRIRKVTFEETGKANLEIVKERIKRDVSANEGLWEASTDVAAFLLQVDAAADFPELIEAVSNTMRSD